MSLSVLYQYSSSSLSSLFIPYSYFIVIVIFECVFLAFFTSITRLSASELLEKIPHFRLLLGVQLLRIKEKFRAEIYACREKKLMVCVWENDVR